MSSPPKKTAHFPAALLLAGLLASCTVQPTPYQPLGEEGGYEETRLQKDRYRVSFKANRQTPETDVVDYLYLRSAQLTKEAGFTHYVVLQDFGKTQTRLEPRAQVGIGLGFHGAGRSSLLGFGFGAPIAPTEYQSVVNYRLGVFVIRMMDAEAAKGEEDALDADFLIESISKKLADRIKPPS